MKNLKPLALAGAAALVLTAAYSVQSNTDDKAALKAARQEYLQAKKDALRFQALNANTADGLRARGTSVRNSGEVTPISLLSSAVGSPSNAAPAASSGEGAVGNCADFYGTIDAVGDVDVYSVALTAGDLVQVSVVSEGAGAPQDLFLSISGAQNANNPDCTMGSVVATADDEYGLNMSTLDPCSFFQAAEDGTYFITVSDLLGLTGGPDQAYHGRICKATTVETEPNDMTPEPLVLLADAVGSSSTKKGKSSSSQAGGGGCHVSGSIGGQLSSGADVDCYAVTLAEAQNLSCRLSGAECANDLGEEIDAELTVTDANAAVVAHNDDTDGSDPSVTFSSALGGIYTICVSSHNPALVGDTAFYSLTCNAACSNEAPGSDDCNTATPVALP